MFTGIIETLGKLTKIEKEGSNIHFTFESPITNELKVDQSVAHNGVCLTVVQLLGDNQYTVTAIDETLQRTNLGELIVGGEVNLERCMPANGRFDGHIVQGHVDQLGDVLSVEGKDGSHVFSFKHSAGENFTVDKGSITINGVSLTAFDTSDTGFSVAIIPYTLEHTVFKSLKVADKVNLEFDILGKYVARMMAKR
ncbi:MAG TPA: riboflavin synthase [Flavobacteriales bacterium]|nr:riboflavin synthase [Flavobacteriales bacterium]